MIVWSPTSCIKFQVFIKKEENRSILFLNKDIYALLLLQFLFLTVSSSCDEEAVILACSSYCTQMHRI